MVRFELTTPRLVIDELREEDLAALAELFADPEAMRYFPHPYARDEAREPFGRQRRGYRERGFGLWALRLKATGEFIGDCGLMPGAVEGRGARGSRLASAAAPLAPRLCDRGGPRGCAPRLRGARARSPRLADPAGERALEARRRVAGKAGRKRGGARRAEAPGLPARCELRDCAVSTRDGRPVTPGEA